jgi:ferric-dicitrate binding protein FerR (iron transport regulator)
MPEQPRTTKMITAEARAWFAKLSNPVVSNKDIWEWADWIRDPANRVAYNRIEARSRKAPDDCLFTEIEILAALKRRPDLARAYRVAFKRAERPSALSDIARELAARIAP